MLGRGRMRTVQPASLGQRQSADLESGHAEALAAGARDNGAPGLRPHYHPDYYGAFVLDPDGINIEAVCHRAEH